MTDIYVADYHEHGPLFDFDNPHTMPHRAAGSVYLCDCGTYIRNSTMAGGWVPVHWWNFRARRRIAEWKRTNTTGDAE